MERVQPGMEVYSYTTRIGTVEGVEQDARSDRPALVIRRDGGLLQAAAEATYELRGGVVRVDEALLQDCDRRRERSRADHPTALRGVSNPRTCGRRCREQ